MSATSDFYLAQADKCAADAAASPLVQVRERNERAELAWRAMAERLIQSETTRAKQAATAAAAQAQKAADETAQAESAEPATVD
jgi:hypothetical protein